jgi:hypothetical protein
MTLAIGDTTAGLLKKKHGKHAFHDPIRYRGHVA